MSFVAGLLLSAYADGTMRPLCLSIGLSGVAVLACERAYFRVLRKPVGAGRDAASTGRSGGVNAK